MKLATAEYRVMARINNMLARKLAVYEQCLIEIQSWVKAYPTEVFPEPDMVQVKGILEAAGLSLDAVSASNIRAALSGIRTLVDVALAEDQDNLL